MAVAEDVSVLRACVVGMRLDLKQFCTSIYHGRYLSSDCCVGRSQLSRYFAR